jgi:hypothetical protein
LSHHSRCCFSTAGSASCSLCERVLLSLRSVSRCTFHSVISRLLSPSWEWAVSSSASFSHRCASALMLADQVSFSFISAISCVRSTVDITCLLVSYELQCLVLKYSECWSLSPMLGLLFIPHRGQAVDQLLRGRLSSGLGSLHETRDVVRCGLAIMLSSDGVRARPLPWF